MQASNLNTDEGEGLAKIKAESSVKAEVKDEPIKEEPAESSVKAEVKDEPVKEEPAEYSVKAEVKDEPIKEEPAIEEGTADFKAFTGFTGTFQHPANNNMGFNGANDGFVQHLTQIRDVAKHGKSKHKIFGQELANTGNAGWSGIDIKCRNDFKPQVGAELMLMRT